MWVGTKECINEASELRMMQLGGVCREEEGSLLQAGDSPACQESEEDREAVLTELRTWWWSVKSGQVRSMWHSCMSWMQALIPSSCLYNGGLHWPMAVLPCVSCLSRTCSAQGQLLRQLYFASYGDCQKCANIYTYTRRLAKINNTMVMVRRAQRWQHYRLRPEREGWVWGPSQPGPQLVRQRSHNHQVYHSEYWSFSEHAHVGDHLITTYFNRILISAI